MKLAPQSREILRQYKALINGRRRDAGQRELTTAQVMDEICEYMTCQPARKTRQAGTCGGRTRAALLAAPRPFPPLTQMTYTDSRVPFLSEYMMSGFNLAATSKDEQDKVTIDLVASGVAYKERLAMPVVAELVVREQPEHLRAYFWGRMHYYRQFSAHLPAGQKCPGTGLKRG